MSSKSIKMAHPGKRAVAKRLARELWEPGSRVRRNVLKVLAAEQGITTRAIQKWMKEPEFIATVRGHIERFDDAFDDGLELCLRGDGEKIGPNAAVLIWYGKTRFNRDEKLKHQTQKHKHALVEIEKRAELGLPTGDGDATYRVLIGEYGDDVPEPETQH